MSPEAYRPLLLKNLHRPDSTSLAAYRENPTAQTSLKAGAETAKRML